MNKNFLIKIELRHEKTKVLHDAKTKVHISCAVTQQLISVFVFATQIVQFLFYLYSKFQAYSLIFCDARLCGTWSETPKTGFLFHSSIYCIDILHNDMLPLLPVFF